MSSELDKLKISKKTTRPNKKKTTKVEKKLQAEKIMKPKKKQTTH